MIDQSPRTAPTLRGPLAGVSALLVFSLLLSATLNVSSPGVEPRRESPTERVAVREAAPVAVRAVRRPTRTDNHRPCVRMAAVCRAAARAPIAPALAELVPLRPALLRPALLDLPPPGCLA